MVHIARKLEALHAAGWVHRDLKPGNTIWLPSKNAWALIDFGIACETGQDSELSFSLYYAPPEVIQLYKAGAMHVRAHPSADVWALGVRSPAVPYAACQPLPHASVLDTVPSLQIMTWELLTETKFFGEGADMGTVVDALTGQTQLPTERPLSREVRKSLGNQVYRESVLAMLSRDPSQRPSMARVVRLWTSVFQSTSA